MSLAHLCYGRAFRHPYGCRRRRVWALIAVLVDDDFPPFTKAKRNAIIATRQPKNVSTPNPTTQPKERSS